MMTLTVK